MATDRRLRASTSGTGAGGGNRSTRITSAPMSASIMQA
jgi:hypothetical protein